MNISSDGHFVAGPDLDDPSCEHREYEPWSAYGPVDVRNILFTVELERLLGHRGVHAYAVHPGLITTDLFRHLDASDTASIFGRGERMSGAASAMPAAKNVEGGSYLADCLVSEAAAWATDPEAARQLRKLSERLVGSAGTRISS